MKNQENMISGENELFSENKKLNENLTDIQKKIDLMARDNRKLQSKFIVAEKKASTLQENLRSHNFRT